MWERGGGRKRERERGRKSGREREREREGEGERACPKKVCSKELLVVAFVAKSLNATKLFYSSPK